MIFDIDMQNNSEASSKKVETFTGDVMVMKFIMEFKKYPNGKVYFSRCYPIGEHAQKGKKVKKAKKAKIQTVAKVQEEIL